MKSIPAIFLRWQSAHLPSLITMVITHPCDFNHSDPTLDPDNRLWAKLICSITQNSPWSFKHFFSLFYLPFINLSISNSTCQLTSPGLFIFISNGLFAWNQIGFTCNLIYLKWIKIGVAGHTLLMSSFQSRPKHTVKVYKVCGYVDICNVDRKRKKGR